MIIKKPTQQEIEQCVEIYHKYPTKGITFDMLKECRKVTALGYMDIKNILLEYIETLK